MKRNVHWHKTHEVNKMLDDWRITALFNGIQRPMRIITTLQCIWHLRRYAFDSKTGLRVSSYTSQHYKFTTFGFRNIFLFHTSSNDGTERHWNQQNELLAKCVLWTKNSQEAHTGVYQKNNYMHKPRTLQIVNDLWFYLPYVSALWQCRLK